MAKSFSEIRDGMQIDWNVPLAMDDGVVLRADIYRPVGEGKYPAIVSYGPYGKGLAFQKGYPDAWNLMVGKYPDTASGSTNKYQSWEVVDPEKWIFDGYAVVRVDSRGAGCSAGYLDPFSPREARDCYLSVEWAASQPWSNGKVGLNGISYYAIMGWLTAGLQPPHLAAVCVWEGMADQYRDAVFHGGINCSFLANWYDMQVKTVQYGLGERGGKNPVTGEPVAGDITLSDEELAANRCDLAERIASAPLDGPFYRDRSAQLDKITVPLLSAGNWGGHGLHLRGNIEGFARAASKHKWLEVHGGEHWTGFYTDYGIELQKRFFGYFLRGKPTGWDKQPPVQLQVRHVDRFVTRHENEWPLGRTRWTRLYLDPVEHKLADAPPGVAAKLEFDALGPGLTFVSPCFEQETEITGPMAAKLFVSSSTTDADLFLVFRLFGPDMLEVTFAGAIDPRTPVAQGWLRASQRKLDVGMSTPWRPYHSHDEVRPLAPGVPVELDIEIWPTSIVVPAGYRVALSVRGRDFEVAKGEGHKLSHFRNEMLGCGPFLHDDPKHRPPEVFSGITILHFDAEYPSYVLVPVIPPKQERIGERPGT